MIHRDEISSVTNPQHEELSYFLLTFPYLCVYISAKANLSLAIMSFNNRYVKNAPRRWVVLKKMVRQERRL